MSDADAPRGYRAWEVAVSAVAGVAVAAAAIWWASGFAVFYETLPRIGPTVEGGGVGTDFVESVGWLDSLIALVHLADVVLGLFILVLFFVHWLAFRRLAGRMRQPGEEPTATDGGERR